MEIIGAGGGGPDELRKFVDGADSSVQWAFLKFEVGSGAFRRQKLLFLHINPWACPAVKRGRANQHTDWVRSFICDPETTLKGGPKSCLSLAVSSKADITAKELLSKVQNVYVQDDLGEGGNVQWVSECSRKQVTRGSLAAASPVKEQVVECSASSSSHLFTDGRQALKAVGEPCGAWNWVLLKSDPAKLELIAGGGGGADEMREFAATRTKEVLTGLLRLSFGEGRLRRCKHVLAVVVGEQVGAVARGRASLVRAQMEKDLAQFVLVSCVVEVFKAEDLSMEILLAKVRQAAHIDDEVLDGDTATVRKFSSACSRTASRGAPPVAKGLKHDIRTRFKDMHVRDAVKLMHVDTFLSWGLFGLADVPNGRQAVQRLHSCPG